MGMRLRQAPAPICPRVAWQHPAAALGQATPDASRSGECGAGGGPSGVTCSRGPTSRALTQGEVGWDREEAEG